MSEVPMYRRVLWMMLWWVIPEMPVKGYLPHKNR